LQAGVQCCVFWALTGDTTGGSDAQTPQRPNTSHILARLFASSSVSHRIETPRAHEMPPSHMLDHAHEGLQGESHEDIGSSYPYQHCYPRARRVQSSRTLSINLLVDKKLIPLKIQQIPGNLEYIK